jgi:hypothetical protein
VNKVRLWNVYGSLPPPTGKDKTWRQNVHLSIVCNTIQQALAMFEQEHPGAIAYSVQDRGEVDLILPEGARL